MDGLALAAEIQKVSSAQLLPIIMLTSLGGRETLREAGGEAVKFAAFLTKPIKPSQLYNVFVNIFDEQQPYPAQPMEKETKSRFDAHMGERHPLHILLAEDHPTNQKLALRLLERLGYRADVAANGLEALAAIERQHYDVILMDMQMPEMDGLDASRRVRRREAKMGTDPVRIVAMTANAMQGDRELCLAAGMDDYISKPIRIEALVAALNKTPAHVHHDVHHQENDMDDHNAVLDTAKLDDLLDMTGGDPEFLAEMIDSYLTTTPPLLAQLQQSLADSNAAAFRLAAHTLKSGSADFGAMTLSTLCSRLEEMGKTGQLDGAGPLVAQAETLYQQVENALITFKDRPGQT
jgi:CheY-like chemotaxis protein